VAVAVDVIVIWANSPEYTEHTEHTEQLTKARFTTSSRVWLLAS
jgi:hypothetical protein